MQNTDISDGDFAARVIAIVASQDITIDTQKITPATTLEELQFDSFDAVTLMFALEEEFGIEITDDDARDLKTVGDVIARSRSLYGLPPAAT